MQLKSILKNLEIHTNHKKILINDFGFYFPGEIYIYLK